MATHLVTGGGGFVGSSLVERLLAAGETVRVLDDFTTGRRSNLESMIGKLEILEGSICDEDAVKSAMHGVDVVFHEAAIPSVSRSLANPAASMRVNAQGTAVVLEGARHAGVRRVVYAASSSVYGDTPTLPKVETMPPSPQSPYAVSKLAGEHLMRVYARIHGLETVSLRYFNVFGPRQDRASSYAAVVPHFVTAALAGKTVTIQGDGEQTRDFCFIDNTVDANLLAAQTQTKLQGEVVNVACGERTSLNQLLSMVADLTGAKLVPSYLPSRPGDVHDSMADITAARALLGYEPKIPVREGLKRTIAAYRANAG